MSDRLKEVVQLNLSPEDAATVNSLILLGVTTMMAACTDPGCFEPLNQTECRVTFRKNNSATFALVMEELSGSLEGKEEEFEQWKARMQRAVQIGKQISKTLKGG
jgi:hypothetical protein